MAKVGRNDPCPCGSGKKYKKCCEKKSSMQRRTFANLSPQAVQSSMDKISGMVSRNIGPQPTSDAQVKVASLKERISTSAPEKNAASTQEEKSEVSEESPKEESTKDVHS